MNIWISLGRKLRRQGRKLMPRYDREDLISKLQRFFAHEVLISFGRWLRSAGRQKFLHFSDSGSAGFEIRRSLFRKLKLYVEGYLADISHRHFEGAPDPMPANQKARKHWGQKMLKKLSEKYDDHDDSGECMKYAHHGDQGKDWAELGRIYKWMIEDWPNWENPYWKKAPSAKIEQNKPITFCSEEELKEFNRLTSKAERLDWITEERVRDRARRLFNRRHLLRYD